MSEWIESWIDYYFNELGQTEQYELTFRFICFGLIAVNLFLCVFNWSITARDIGFSLSMMLVYAFVKLYATVVDTILPDR